MFSLFQALFPLIGFYLGTAFMSYIEGYDHWVAFGLLLIIGGKMVFDAIKGLAEKTKDDELKKKDFSYWQVIVQAVAVSIDAFAVGISLISFPLNIYIDIAFIGIITFLICIPRIYLGNKIVKLLKGKRISPP